MDKIRFERIAGEGETALYNLYVDGKRVGDALTLPEVLAEIGKLEAGKADA